MAVQKNKKTKSKKKQKRSNIKLKLPTLFMCSDNIIKRYHFIK